MKYRIGIVDGQLVYSWPFDCDLVAGQEAITLKAPGQFPYYMVPDGSVTWQPTPIIGPNSPLLAPLTMEEAELGCTRTMPTDADYEKFINRIDITNVKLIHAAFGLMSEVGEIADALKRWFMYGKAIDRVNLFEEGGDVSWYLRLLASSLRDVAGGEYGFEEMIRRNIAKLKATYPNAFTEASALNRDLAAERSVLEGKP